MTVTGRLGSVHHRGGFTMVILGGSLTQVAFPLLFFGYFLRKREDGRRHDVFAAMVCLWWSAIGLLATGLLYGVRRCTRGDPHLDRTPAELRGRYRAGEWRKYLTRSRASGAIGSCEGNLSASRAANSRAAPLKSGRPSLR